MKNEKKNGLVTYTPFTETLVIVFLCAMFRFSSFLFADVEVIANKSL